MFFWNNIRNLLISERYSHVYIFILFWLQNTTKRIPLESAEIAEAAIDKRDNTFRIKPKDSRRIFYLCAEDESSQHDWMQAICFAKATGRSGGQSEACVVQWRILPLIVFVPLEWKRLDPQKRSTLPLLTIKTGSQQMSEMIRFLPLQSQLDSFPSWVWNSLSLPMMWFLLKGSAY